jgi:hypothetical protein
MRRRAILRHGLPDRLEAGPRRKLELLLLARVLAVIGPPALSAARTADLPSLPTRLNRECPICVRCMRSAARGTAISLGDQPRAWGIGRSNGGHAARGMAVNQRSELLPRPRCRRLHVRPGRASMLLSLSWPAERAVKHLLDGTQGDSIVLRTNQEIEAGERAIELIGTGPCRSRRRRIRLQRRACSRGQGSSTPAVRHDEGDGRSRLPRSTPPAVPRLAADPRRRAPLRASSKNSARFATRTSPRQP